MGIIGPVENVWRHAVKSMRGEAMSQIFAGFSGSTAIGSTLLKAQPGPRGAEGIIRAGDPVAVMD